MTGTDLAAPPQTEEALALSARAGGGQSADDFVIPRLKIGQGTTTEVAEGDAARGDLINSLTGEVYEGQTIDLIVINTFKGRSWRNEKTNTFYTAGEHEVIVPERWQHPSAGQYFIDAPDAEERFKEAVNNNTRDWGKGPPIATTYNFVCLIVGEDDLEPVPVQVSLSKSSAKEGRNWLTMTNIGGAPWDKVYTLSTSQVRSKNDQPFTAVKIKIAGKTTPDQRQKAVTASAFVQSAAVAYAPEDAPEAEPVEEKTGLRI